MPLPQTTHIAPHACIHYPVALFRRPIPERATGCGKAWAIGALLAFGLSGCSGSPEGAVDKFYRAMERGQIETAMQYVSTTAVEHASADRFRRGMIRESERLQACGGIRSIESKLEGEGDLRYGQVKLVFHENCRPTQRSERHRVIRENGAWKLAR